MPSSSTSSWPLRAIVGFESLELIVTVDRTLVRTESLAPMPPAARVTAEASSAWEETPTLVTVDQGTQLWHQLERFLGLTPT